MCALSIVRQVYTLKENTLLASLIWVWNQKSDSEALVPSLLPLETHPEDCGVNGKLVGRALPRSMCVW